MSPKNLAKIDVVTHAFAEWKCVQQKVSRLETQFNDAMALYSKGEGEFPDHLYAELKELRREANALFQLAAQSLRTAAGDKVGKDSGDSASAFGDLLE